MTIDLTGLTPAPWTAEPSCVTGGGYDVPELPEAFYRDSRFENKADAEFIALARNAYDVMLRRGWYVVPTSRGKAGTWWIVRTSPGGYDMPLAYLVEHPTRGECSDPYSALCDADAWMTAQEKGAST